ncbi:MAG: hypothetical protein CL565_04250 [Alphaproteobacteria bacterium]|nr:hypothetical protein [Alphaproteobacteria bacterium]|tara:strand:+ start:544 stop:969 length:426 start_codon:yes stop_codon:yes gene_type:complete
MGSFYPIIVTDKFEKTINFYEDFLEFSVENENDGFAVLQHKSDKTIRLGVARRSNSDIPQELASSLGGTFINISVPDLEYAYDRMYMEGLEIITEPKKSHCGRKFFMIRDPNGSAVCFAEEETVRKNIWLSDTPTSQFAGV